MKTKVCKTFGRDGTIRGCGQEKSIDDFYKVKSNKDGHMNICKLCANEKDRKYYWKHRDTRIPQMNDWYANNTDKKAKQQKEWASNNQDKVNSFSAKRRAMKKEATAEDADPKLIEQFYTEAKTMTNATGIQFHVDHVVPLSQGGLHHQDNLRVISYSDNCSKSARDPSEQELALAGKLRFPELFGQDV